MKNLNIIFTLLVILVCNACNTNHQSKEEPFPPKESELHKVPNCAADGEGCGQFNPNL